jgi:hypothetical protein
MVLVRDLAKHFFFLWSSSCASSNKFIQGSGLQEPDPEPPVFTLQIEYPYDTGANDLLVGSTVVLPKNNLKTLG